MDAFQAKRFIQEEAEEIFMKGETAKPPSAGEFMMAVIVLLNDLEERVSALEPSGY